MKRGIEVVDMQNTAQVQDQTEQLANQGRPVVHRADLPCRAVRVRVLCCQEGQEDRFRGTQALSTRGTATGLLCWAVASLTAGDSTDLRALFMEGARVGVCLQALA